MTATSLSPQAAPAAGSARHLLRAPLLAGAGVAAATVALHVRDPHTKGAWGLCPMSLLGFDCPGCGGLRAVNDLTHGNVIAALSSNVMVVAMMPIAVVLWARWLYLSAHGIGIGPGLQRVPRWVVPAFAAVMIGFAIVRNTPWGSWLHS